MNYDLLITKAYTGLGKYYDYKEDYCTKEEVLVEILTSYRPFIAFYQKITGDYKGENVYLNYQSLPQMYFYCCKAVHANEEVPNHLKVKKLKQDFKTLIVTILGKKTYQRIKKECKWNSQS